MARACVIVLDAVGAGELPDAAEFGDAGSNTLANVARAVGGLDLPTLEALGLGNVEPLDGCAPQPGAPGLPSFAVQPGLPSVSLRTTTKLASPRSPIVIICPPATETVEYPFPRPVALQARGGPPAGQS